MLKKISKCIILLLVLGLVFSITNNVVSSADYPDGDVEIVVAYSAGGGTDVMTRTLVQYVEEELDNTFYVNNMPGAGALIGVTHMVNSEPDGYTLSTINTMSILTFELTNPDVNFTVEEDIQPVAQVVFDPSTIFVRVDSDFQDLDDVVEYAKNNPGDIAWGGTTPFGAHHLPMIMLENEADIDLTYIPHDGAADSRAAILGGHIDIVAGGVSEYIELVNEGELRPIAMAASERMEAFEDIPTYNEFGYDVEVGSSRAFGVPADTPMDRVNLLAETIEKVMESDEFIERAKNVGIYETLSFRGPEDQKEFLLNLQENVKEALPEEELVN